MRCGVPHYCNLRTNLIKLTNNKHFLAETEYSIMNGSKKKKSLVRVAQFCSSFACAVS